MVCLEITKTRAPDLVLSFQHAQTVCPIWNKCRCWRPLMRTWLKAQTPACEGCARMSVTVHFPLPTAWLCRRDSLRLVSQFRNLSNFVNSTPDKTAEWKPGTFSGFTASVRNSNIHNSKEDFLQYTPCKLLVLGINCGIYIEKLHVKEYDVLSLKLHSPSTWRAK
jgi:hypothetical protein